MGEWSATGLTGNGHALIGNGGSPPSDIYMAVTAFPPKSRTIGTDPTEIQTVKYLGRYGIGCFADDPWACDPPIAMMWEDIHFVSQDINIVDRWGPMYAPSVWWALHPGAEITLQVFW